MKKKKINRKSKNKAVYPKIEIIKELKINKRRKPYKKRKQTIAKQKRGPRGPYKKKKYSTQCWFNLDQYINKVLVWVQKIISTSALGKMFKRNDCSSVVATMMVRSVDVCLAFVVRLYKRH